MRIWGIPKDLSEMSPNELEVEISKREGWISRIQKGARFADSGSYGQDLTAARSYEQEVAQLKLALQGCK